MLHARRQHSLKACTCVHDAGNDGNLTGSNVVFGLLLLILGSWLVCSVSHNLACNQQQQQQQFCCVTVDTREFWSGRNE